MTGIRVWYDKRNEFILIDRYKITPFMSHSAVLIVLTVPDRILGKFLDPGIQGTSPDDSVCVGGRGEQPKPSLSALILQKSSSRDPAAMEETWP